MLKWFPRLARFVYSLLLVLFLTSTALLGQEPKSPSDAAAKAAPPPAPAQEPAPVPAPAPAPAGDPAAKPPADVTPVPATPSPAEQPKVEATPPPVILPPFDFSRLAHPSVADQLELSDEQRSAVVQLINERAQALASAPPEKRAEVLAGADQKLIALLNEGQRAKLVTLAETQKLRFNFRFQKWADVLDWFARQAGMALVMDQPPQGAFTYSDNRAYSPTEAIDLLNSVLLTKGFTLLQRGRMLILVDLSKELPSNLIPRVPPEEIAQRGKFEMITVLFPLGRRSAETVVKEIEPLMGAYGKCVGLPQTGQLLVTDTAGKLQALSILIASIPEPEQPKPPVPKPEPPPPVLAVYPVTSIDPAAAVETLKVLFAKAEFRIDDKVDQIMAYATPGEQAAIKAAIDQMQANRSPETTPRLEIYPLDLADTTGLVEQLQTILPKIQATVDPLLGRLLVFAEPKDQEQVKAIVQKLGTSADSGGKQVVVYQLKHFDPTALTTLVKQLLPRVEISSDVKLRRVVVGTSPGNQAMVKSLVEQLDQESALEDKPLLQLYPLAKRLDETVLTTLRPLVPDAQLTLSADGRQLTVVARVVDQTVVKKLVDQWQELAAAREEPALKIYTLGSTLTAADVATLKSLVPAAEVTLAPDGRQLRVVARATDQTQIESLIKELETAATAESKPGLQIYPLGKAINPSLLATMSALVPSAKVSVSADTKQLIVVAQPADQDIIKKTLDQISVSADTAKKHKLELYQVEGISAAQLQALLQTLVVESTITVDTPQDRLIVWGPEEEHLAFADVIAKLEQDPLAGTKPVLQFYPLSDETLSSSITSVLTTMVPTAKVTWDADGRRLMVIATPKDQQVVRRTIEEVTKDAGPVEQQVLRLYALSAAQRPRFQAVQADLLLRFPGMRVIEDPQTGELAIWAKATQHEKLAVLVESLGVTSDASEQPVLISYAIEQGSAKTAFEMLKQVYPTVKLTLDEKAARVLAYAPLSVHARIKQSIGQVDVAASPNNQEELRSYSAGDVNPTPLLTMLQSLLPDMQITADLPARKIIAWGTASDHAVLEKAMEQFRSGDPALRPVVKVYPVEGRDVTALTQLRSVLLQVVPDAVIGIDSRGGSVVVSARESDHQKIQAAVDQVVQMDRLTEMRLETYTLDKIKSTPALVTLRLIAPTAQMSVGAVPEQIVVWASSEDHQRVQAALQKLEETGGADASRELRVHRIRKAASTQATSIITTTLPDLQVLAGQGTDQLLIWGSPKDHARLDELIQQIEQELRLDVERELKTFELENVDPAEARRVLDSAVGNLEYVTTTVPGRLVIRAEPAAFEQVEKVLAELKLAVAAPEQVVRVHRYDPDELSVATLYAALSTRDMKDLSIQVTPTTNSLIVRGPAPRQDELAATLSQLALQMPAPDKPVAEVYRLQRAEVSAAAVVIRSLIPTAVVSPDTTNQTLAVTATAKDHEKIKALVAQLDSNEGGELITEAYVLKKAYPTSIMTAVKPIVPRAIISPDVYSKTLIVTATAEDHKKIKAIIDQADGLSQGELTTKAYPLQWVSPSALMTALTPIVPNATLSPDVYSKTLIVTANESDHQRVATVLEQADQRGGGELTTTAHAIKWANPATIAVALTSVVPDAKVSSDVVNKMLIVTASAKDHERIQAVLEQADKRGGGGELVTRAYTLQTANPSTISVALTPVVPNATISSDPTNQMLVVTASEEDHVRIKAIIDEADRRQDGELITEVYALKWANPTALSYSIKPIAPHATVSPDIYNKTLIVSATAKDHARIKPVIDQADSRGGGDLVTTAYALKWANPTTVSTALTSVVPDAKVSSDTVNKMLIVTASADDHKRILGVLEQADKRGGAGDLVTKAYTLRVANPSTIMVALTPVVPNATISSDPTNQMLVVTASEEDHARVKAIVDEADHRQDGELTTEVYALKWANPVALSTSIKPIAPNALASPDVYNKTLIVTASAKDHARIKAVIDQADSRGGDLITQAYTLKWANATTVSTALTNVVPDAKISSDITNKMLIVTASKADHQQIQAVLDQADKRGGGDLATKAYTLRTANPSTIMTALLPVVPDAKISADVTNQLLIVTASDADHLRIKTIVDEADQLTNGELVTQVYTLKWANPTALSTSIRPVAPRATLSPDVYNKTLIVTATAQDQDRIKAIVEQADRRGEGELSTQVYAFKLANPATVATALGTLMPNATMSSDTTTNTLIVTASAEDHKLIEPIVQQLDVSDPKANILKPYNVQNADPQQVYRSLTQLFRTSRNVSVGYQEETGMILVFAPAADQEEVARAISDIDKATVGRPKAMLEVYSLEGLDGRAAVDALDALLVDETPKVELRVDLTNNQVLAIAEPKQHEMLRKALLQLSPEKRDVEVFTLQHVDPYAAQSAVSTLFADLPLAATPSVEADPNTQQLMVRATKSQIERIRLLFEKMGEGPQQRSTGASGGMLRILPLSGDVENTLRQIERIWPQVRGNPIQVITPPTPNRGSDTRREEPAPEPTRNQVPPSAPSEDIQPPPAGESGDNAKSARAATIPALFVSAQTEPASSAQPASPADTTAAATGLQPAAQPQTPQEVPPALPPIVVIAGDGRLTVASRDPEALDQFENLLKTLQRGRRVRIETGNYAIFLLQNADAMQLAEVLQSAFRRGPRGGADGSYRPTFRRSTNLTVVPDERMNALLVYGSVADRDAIEEMLDVLDSIDIPDSLTTPRPEMIPVKNLPAMTILEVLKSVYKTQLSARSGVKPMTIPQGISFEMSSMLQLINAAAEAPLLTLDVDLTTNSIVLRAPRQLSEEIEEFITELDEQAKDGGKRNISLVPLKTMNTTQVQEALQLLMRGGRYRARQ